MTCLFSPSASMFLFLFSVFCSLLKSAPKCISWSVLFGLCATSCSYVCVCVCVCVCIHFINSENFYTDCNFKPIPSVFLSILFLKIIQKHCLIMFLSKQNLQKSSQIRHLGKLSLGCPLYSFTFF